MSFNVEELDTIPDEMNKVIYNTLYAYLLPTDGGGGGGGRIDQTIYFFTYFSQS